jgi:hypothetical protein
VGSRLTAAILIAALAVVSPTAEAASKKPTPKPTAKVTTKASAKASVKPTAKATSKPTAKATSKPTAKATAKSTATAKATAKPKATAKATKKAVVKKKKKPRKKVRVTPSPKPSWPPKGFSVEGEVYAKVPTDAEFVGITSNIHNYDSRKIAKDIVVCEKEFLCGKLQVASETGCIWWEVISDVLNGKKEKLGEMTSSFSGSNAKVIKPILLISPESASQGGVVLARSVICHHEDRVTGNPAVVYKKNN